MSDLFPPFLTVPAFLAAFLHALLPTHWLPFVLVGRAQGWGMGKVMAVVITAAVAHMASTGLIGALVAAAGAAAEAWVKGALPVGAGLVLLAFGAWYLWRSHVGRREMEAMARPRVSDAAAFWGLVGLLALSPGEALLPLYLTAAPYGAAGVAILTMMLLLGTVGGMALFAGLAQAGVERLKLARLAPWDRAVLGLALAGLGLYVLIDALA
ncbi:hypothetical protein Q0812_06845 [Brevundimonas sp. 2R-24]|uniref:Threonine/homoserine/homoserine lactone efflux protein n=1 Tax=Peiella sedimenti TaxID=3061083 RepID=A0ABT8SME8_9CAUL|nr:hypothetical protein [Caulobacteraceae bacterium XZ-24]